jgi:hypothetical protein
MPQPAAVPLFEPRLGSALHIRQARHLVVHASHLPAPGGGSLQAWHSAAASDAAAGGDSSAEWSAVPFVAAPHSSGAVARVPLADDAETRITYRLLADEGSVTWFGDEHSDIRVHSSSSSSSGAASLPLLRDVLHTELQLVAGEDGVARLTAPAGRSRFAAVDGVSQVMALESTQ